jgi:hypothetical protein
MKQGSGRSSHSGGKVEPTPHAVKPAFVAQLGTSMGNHVTEKGTVRGGSVTMDAGRGFKAPHDDHCTAHKAGSQGRHR